MTTTDPANAVTQLSSFRSDDVATADVQQIVALLDLQAAEPAFQALKSWALASLAPQPGETAVDIGSGTGEDVRAFADLVGESGRAIGVEVNPGVRAVAVQRAAEANSRAEYIDGDALALPFDDASVDVVRSERVFQHLSDPFLAAREIARVLRPGGRVVLIDTDWFTTTVHPVPEDLREQVDSMTGTNFPNPRSGRMLGDYLHSAGLSVTDRTAQVWLQHPSRASLPPASLIGKQAAIRGLLTEEQGEELRAGLAQAGEQGWFHMSLTMFATLAVKPSS